jgi:hypothetical protein
MGAILSNTNINIEAVKRIWIREGEENDCNSRRGYESMERIKTYGSLASNSMKLSVSGAGAASVVEMLKAATARTVVAVVSWTIVSELEMGKELSLESE